MQENTMRLEMLFREEQYAKIKQASLLVFGAGGVGSFALEALARSGIKKIIVVDKDVVAISNLNRQLIALNSTIGQDKVEVVKKRINDINQKIEVITFKEFVDENNIEKFLELRPDFVIDAIDTVNSKLTIYQKCLEKDIPFISCLGTGNRLDPLQLKICDLRQTSGDPLAKVLRNQVKKRQIKGKITVIYSQELPNLINKVTLTEGMTRKEKHIVGSSPFVPSSAGLAIASYVVRKLAGD